MKTVRISRGLFLRPFSPTVKIAEKKIQIVKRVREDYSGYLRIYSGVRMCKFFIFDLTVGISQFFFSREKGSSRIFRALTENGPMVMKLGQFLSSRSDILPNEVTSKLKIIQKNAPVFSEKICRDPLEVLHKETGVLLPRSSLKGRIGSGCISQVYKIEIGKREYALKIIEEKTRGKIQADLEVLKIFSKIFGADRFYQEFKRNMSAQMDLRREKENTERFRRNFSLFQSPLENPSVLIKVLSYFNGTSVIFPKPVVATENILLTEYWEGEEMERDPGGNALFVFLKMVFSDRFVHSDLHPGNISFLPVVKDRKKFAEKDSLKKTVIIYDSGLAHSLTKDQRKNLADLVKALLLDRKKEALSLIIERNRLNTHTEAEKAAFLRSALDSCPTPTDKNPSIAQLSQIANIYFLARRHKVFFDSAYTNIVLSAIYMQKHLKAANRFTWVSALKTGTLVDYLDLFFQWKIDQLKNSAKFFRNQNFLTFH